MYICNMLHCSDAEMEQWGSKLAFKDTMESSQRFALCVVS